MKFQIALVGLFVFSFTSVSDAAVGEKQSERYENIETFQKVLHFVEQNYVEEVKNRQLIQGAIKGMLETLDPHSNFLTAEVFRDMKIETSGKFGGIGIEIGMKDNVLTVVTPIEDTPAWKAGIKPNDRILKIDGESTKGMTLADGVAKMRGKKGQAITLTLGKEGSSATHDIKIIRELIKIQSVKSELLESSYGYVRLTNFNETAARDVKKAIEELDRKSEKEGGTKLKGLVFDLRYNPGGLLDQAVDVTSLFIDEGVVVSTIGRNKDQKEVRHAAKGQASRDLLLAVLVNGSSASASEIVAGALQDHNRALVLGQPTFGKGSVQTILDLGQDMGLKLTVARYYTPSGKSIQEKGVTPDVLLEDLDSKMLASVRRQARSVREKDLKRHMTHPDGDSGAKNAQSAVKGGLDEEGEDSSSAFKFSPREDYQVAQALGYLKSFQVFERMNSQTISKKAALKQ
jgi:carboxyl-terminal processing protease